MSLELVSFVVLTALALITGLTVIRHRNQVVAALALAGNLVSIAGFYMLLNAQFLALLQVIVYAGAIMVLILFVLMLLNLPDEARRKRDGWLQSTVGLLLAVAFVAIVGRAIAESTAADGFPVNPAGFGTVESVGTSLFSDYFYAFEAISLLLVVAMVGAVLLAKRRL
ncbi:MAG TPA: NADH-quinone oxidoreductase subunit J [Candidatus Polarisedimenticolaceae bacterium]|nr:NADH-quinone oxidoreductase subunit J [Candidatus Polarisedimenticolaceae bacterium]